MFILGVIPARGGSKGLPRKNVRNLGGRPLISFSIERASKSKLLSQTIFSTDDSEIASIAKEYNADVPFLRPSHLATDTASMIDVLKHAVEWAESEGGINNVDLVVCMQPTSPLGKPEDIDNAISLILEDGCDAVLSVCEVEYTPYYMKKIVKGRLVPLLPDDDPLKPIQRRQDAPPVYKPNGIVSVTKRHVLMEQGLRYGLNTLPYIMSQESSVNIDHEWDLLVADHLIKKKTE